jgi:hypothetical protein
MTALDELIDDYDHRGHSVTAAEGDQGDNLIAAARHEQATLLSLIQTLALALAREYQVPLDECEGGLLGEARGVLGRYPTTNR